MGTFEHPSTWAKRMIEEHGEQSEFAVLWHTHGYQFATMAELLKNLRLYDGCTVLDVGAGRLDLLAFLEERRSLKRYVGVDFSEDLLAIGKKAYPDAETFAGDYLDYVTETRFDFVLANGVMSYAKAYEGNEMAWVNRMIRKMFAECRVGCAFNIPSTILGGFDSDSWFVCDPFPVLAQAFKLTPYVIMDHSSKSGFMTVTMLRR